MTTPRDTPASRRVRANGDGTVYQCKDSRWEAAGYVLAPGNTRKRICVYGTTRKDVTRTFTVLLRKAGLRCIRFHDLRHHAHIGVTATVYAHVRLRLQRDAIDILSTALGGPDVTEKADADSNEPPPCSAPVH